MKKTEKKGKEAKAPEKREQVQKKEQGAARKSPWNVLLYSHLAEKSMNMVEMENKLIFMVRRDATKTQIKDAVERGFDVKVVGVRTEITRQGLKKAYVRLSADSPAVDIASRLGMM